MRHQEFTGCEYAQVGERVEAVMVSLLRPAASCLPSVSLSDKEAERNIKGPHSPEIKGWSVKSVKLSSGAQEVQQSAREYGFGFVSLVVCRASQGIWNLGFAMSLSSKDFIPDDIYDFIVKKETGGRKPATKAFRDGSYADGRPRWSIGFGTESKPGETISEKEAYARFKNHTRERVGKSRQLAGKTLDFNKAQAVISHLYNVGENKPVFDDKGEIDALAMSQRVAWRNPKTKQMEFNPGLYARRAEELQLLGYDPDKFYRDNFNKLESKGLKEFLVKKWKERPEQSVQIARQPAKTVKREIPSITTSVARVPRERAAVQKVANHNRETSVGYTNAQRNALNSVLGDLSKGKNI